MSRQSLGQSGEQAVCDYLVKQGCFLVERNYHAALGQRAEIDIIACDGKNLLFVEVKTRKPDSFLPGILAVTKKKQQNIWNCAQQFLMFHESFACYQPRFDVACVTMENQKVLGMEYYPNAFSL